MAFQHAMNVINLFAKEHTFIDKNTGEERTGKVRTGDLYAATQQKILRLKQRGYKVMEMWAHDWMRHCKKNKINLKGGYSKAFLGAVDSTGGMFWW